MKPALSTAGSRILSKLESGCGLERAEIDEVCGIIDASNRQGLRLCLISISLLWLVLAGIYLAYLSFGWWDESVNVVLMMSAFIPLFSTPFVTVGHLQRAIEARLICRNCGRRFSGFQVHRARDTGQCPYCEASEPFSRSCDDAFRGRPATEPFTLGAMSRARSQVLKTGLLCLLHFVCMAGILVELIPYWHNLHALEATGIIVFFSFGTFLFSMMFVCALLSLRRGEVP